MDLAETFGSRRPIVGMVHLPPQPGAPEYGGDRADVRGRALSDAMALVEGGVDALLVENFGDRPYYPDSVPPHTVAEVTATARELAMATELPFGVNVLRNDAEAALSVAAATGGAFVRINCHAGAVVTDQGILEGRAHETVRLRDRLDADVAILADVDVKHGRDLGDRSLRSTAVDTIERGLADGLIVSGSATGRPPDEDTLRAVVDRVDDRGLDAPVFAGSGVTPENAHDLLDLADGAIVGTTLKRGGRTTNPVDPERVETFVDVVRTG